MTRGLTKSQYDAIIRQYKKNGSLVASEILAAAKRKDSPLHGYFEWDDAKASNEYRLIQARKAIKMANVYIEELQDKFVHVPTITTGEGEYKPLSVVANDIGEFQLAIDEALKRLQAAERAVNDLQVIADSESPDHAGILGIAMKSLETAGSALNKLH